MDTDARWRTQKKVTARFFAPSKLDGGELAMVSNAEYVSRLKDRCLGGEGVLILDRTTTLIYDLLQNPNDFSRHVHRATASFASVALYGQRAKSHEDFWATAAYEALEAVNTALNPGSYLPTEQFPIFKWVPKSWLSSTIRAEQGFSIPTGIWKQAREHVESRRNQGDKRESLIDELLDHDSTNLDPAFQGTKLANFVGALMQAAAETSALTMRTSIMFLATHKWVQEKAQKELDRICGTERMPTFADFKDLPYINCIMKEGLRIRPVVPTGIPHRCTEDNWYEGMLIPKDATIMIPQWALSHSQYSNPDTYNPDRYLNHPGLATEYAFSSDYENRDHYTYGAGRRLCTGIHLAERIQWRMLASLLWAFRIEQTVDEVTGKEIKIDTEAYEEKLITGPKPFKVRFRPRSETHVQIIKKEMAAVKELLMKWE